MFGDVKYTALCSVGAAIENFIYVGIQFAKGNVDQAVHNLKDLINLLNDNNLSDYNKLRNVIKSKIYGNYAMYKIKQFVKNKKKSVL